MKLLLCADIRLGAICAENLDVKLSRKWQNARTEKFVDLMDKAVQNHVRYVFLYGQLFGREKIPESVVDQLFTAVKMDKHIQVVAFLTGDVYNRINYRSDLPENLHLICTQTPDSYLDDDIALRIEKGVTNLQLGDHPSLLIKKTFTDSFILAGLEREETIPSFEPVGFEDAQGKTFGFSILEWDEEKVGPCTTVRNQTYGFREVELKILAGDGEKEILRKINKAIKDVPADTFLRITMAGNSAFGLVLNGTALEAQLRGKIFFVEVHDNTIMDIDEETFENDISLRSEFVRLALQDDSLSESERNRLISCGWNVLNGKEVSAE